ncbi:MAG: BatA domain-containing protein [Verrucomicrobiae bacterium]|nr:BatA domain-containing protein [Verrucomicrobiae bacterium]
MDLIFGNPAGFWALLGLPALLLIHFFQRQSRLERISTLFLLDNIAPRSAQGRKIERLRNSLPLWLQILAVLLITWILLQPRWLSPSSSQSVVVVLDSSFSMQASRAATLPALSARLRSLSQTAARTEWTLLDSHPDRPVLYNGPRLESALEALHSFEARSPGHDPETVLRTGRSLLRKNGILIFVTDRPRVMTPGTEVFSAGDARDNVGFAGMRFSREPGGLTWHALIKNHSDTAATRPWWIEAGGTKSPVKTLSLKPGQVLSLSGPWPEGNEQATLVLGPDGFTLDDRLPLVRPRLKPLRVATAADPDLQPFFEKFLRALPENRPVSLAEADMALLSWDPSGGTRLPPGHAIVFLKVAGQESPHYKGTLLAENLPLMRDLNWRSLLARGPEVSLARNAADSVLLWQGDRPMIFLREEQTGHKKLLINFPLTHSNAPRLASFILLLNRFAEMIRLEKVGVESANTELSQLTPLAFAAEGGPARIVSSGHPAPPVETLDIHPLPIPGTTNLPLSVVLPTRAPSQPVFYSVAQGGTNRLTAAAHFADVPEADFRRNGPMDTVRGKIPALETRNSREDFLTPLWLALLGTLMLGSWAWIERRRA